MIVSSPGSNANPPLPEVDERIVMPGSGYEIDDGKLVRVPPADPPHAECNAQLAALLIAHVRPEFKVAVDMLTRTSLIDDIAPDASIFPRAPHPETGRRQLEHVAFEIASTQSLLDAGRKAAKLVGRGVRRVFAIDVERERVFEWSSELGTWSILDLHASIEDATLAVPLPLAALVDATRAADDFIAAALLAKRTPVLRAVVEEGRAEGRAEGRVEGRVEGRAEGAAEMLLLLLAQRGLIVTDAERDRIRGERDPDRLRRWGERVLTCKTVADLIGARQR